MNDLERHELRCISCDAVTVHAITGDEIVACTCGQLHAVIARFGRLLSTPYDGDPDAAVHRLTQQYGPLLARQKHAGNPQAIAAYASAWGTMLRSRRVGSRSRSREFVTRWLWRAYDGWGWRWLRPIVLAWDRRLWAAHGGMPRQLKSFLDRHRRA
jgi:hypothetical protein